MFCYKCGGELKNDAKFCIHCGAKMSAVKMVPPKAGTKPEPIEDIKNDSTPVSMDKTGAAPVDVYERTQIIQEQSVDYPKTEYIIPPLENEEIRQEEYIKPNKGEINRNTLQVSKPKQTTRWPLVVLLLLVIILSLGVLGALFIFPDEVQQLVTNITGEKRGTGALDDEEEEEQEEGDNEDEETDVAVDEDSQDMAEDASGWQTEFVETVKGLNASTFPTFSMVDIDGDGIPEIIANRSSGANGHVVYHYDEESGVININTKGDSLTFVSGAGMIEDSYTEGFTAVDVVYQVGNGEFKKIFEGSYSADPSRILDENYNPNLKYTADGQEVNYSTYYSNLESMYLNKGVTDIAQVGSVEHDKLLEILKGENPLSDFNTAASKEISNARWEYDYQQNIQYFLAPYSGKYRFTLYGANGGADGDEEFGKEAAVLVGTVKLKAGERIVLLTGGRGAANKYYWNFTTNRGCEVPGGFNGGGECFASGSGGGCTDIYYKGIRIAAAAGSGGGNYEPGTEGKPGRTSSATDNLSNGKKGGGSPSIDVGGSGAGWYGGALGKSDQGGYGGKNGFDASAFTVENEYEGAAFTMSGKRDGSALVEYLGQ